MDPLRHVTIGADFSEEAQHAVARAARLASVQSFAGTLVHVVPDRLPPDVQLKASEYAGALLPRIAEELEGKGARFATEVLHGDVVGKLLEAAGEGLIVAGSRGEGLLLDLAIGRTSSRLVRQAKGPVLIVKRAPDSSYDRVVIATDFSRASKAAAVLAARLAPEAQMHFVHVYDVDFETTMRRVGVPAAQIETYDVQAREQASSAMDGFIAGLRLPAERTVRTITRGYPPRIIADRVNPATQLVALGLQPRNVLERMVVGSVVMRVLERVSCDVLAVPPDA
jgi:nucleotide-binding universal stress UspA family protein